MTDRLDEFESMFRAAERVPYAHQRPHLRKIALVCDGTPEAAGKLLTDVKSFLGGDINNATWQVFSDGDYRNVGELQSALAADPPDLIVTHRHLQEKQLVPQHSLGVYVDVLTQVNASPVLVLPGTAQEPISLAGRSCNRVMVASDHISGQDNLINWGLRMACRSDSSGQEPELHLCHIEDDVVFNRYLQAISQIPEIDTAVAESQLRMRLLKDADDYLQQVQATVENNDDTSSRCPAIKPHVTMGHQLRDFRQLVDQHSIDLLVMNTNDDDQLAMHGLAYALCVELTTTAQLLL